MLASAHDLMIAVDNATQIAECAIVSMDVYPDGDWLVMVLNFQAKALTIKIWSSIYSYFYR